MQKILRLSLLSLGLWGAEKAVGGALDPWATWVAAQPYTSKQIPPVALVARGVGTNAYYVMEVDPATGNLPVSASVNVDLGDQNYGTPTASTLRTAAMLGLGSTAVSNANPVPISDASGSITVDGTVAATQSGTWIVSLPTGASTAANQTTANSSLSAIDTKTPALGQTTMASSSPVTIASNQTALSTTSTNLPETVDTASGASSASTLRTVLATRHEAASTPVSVRISDGSAFGLPANAGRAYADSVRNAYASTAVTTGAWVQLIASTAAVINSITIFDSCGQTLELGTGAAASETRKLIIPPGGIEGMVGLAIPAATRVSVRAISATCSSGELNVTGFQ